jgi:hypothetical protein
MRALQNRLQIEVANKTKALEKKWLLEHLRQNEGWIRKEQAEQMIEVEIGFFFSEHLQRR